MPTYCYKCTECEALLEFRHSYKEKMGECTVCGKPSLEKFLNTPIKYRSNNNTNHKVKPGSVVNTTIQEIKDEVKKEKDTLKKRNR